MPEERQRSNRHNHLWSARAHTHSYQSTQARGERRESCSSSGNANKQTRGEKRGRKAAKRNSRRRQRKGRWAAMPLYWWPALSLSRERSLTHGFEYYYGGSRLSTLFSILLGRKNGNKQPGAAACNKIKHENNSKTNIDVGPKDAEFNERKLPKEFTTFGEINSKVEHNRQTATKGSK